MWMVSENTQGDSGIEPLRECVTTEGPWRAGHGTLSPVSNSYSFLWHCVSASQLWGMSPVMDTQTWDPALSFHLRGLNPRSVAFWQQAICMPLLPLLTFYFNIFSLPSDSFLMILLNKLIYTQNIYVHLLRYTYTSPFPGSKYKNLMSLRRTEWLGRGRLGS